MTRHYSIKAFFRSMPRDLLARYFHDQDVLREFDFSSLDVAHVDHVFEHWLQLPETRRKHLKPFVRRSIR